MISVSHSGVPRPRLAARRRGRTSPRCSSRRRRWAACARTPCGASTSTQRPAPRRVRRDRFVARRRDLAAGDAAAEHRTLVGRDALRVADGLQSRPQAARRRVTDEQDALAAHGVGQLRHRLRGRGRVGRFLGLARPRWTADEWIAVAPDVTRRLLLRRQPRPSDGALAVDAPATVAAGAASAWTPSASRNGDNRPVPPPNTSRMATAPMAIAGANAAAVTCGRHVRSRIGRSIT